MKSLMVVPIYSTKTSPAILQECINVYTYQPDLIDYVMNDVMNPEYVNQADYKTIQSFKQHRPTDFVIYHASDLVVDPDDLDTMIEQLNDDEDAFAVGLYPLNRRGNHTRLGEDTVFAARVVVWKADIFEACLFELEKQQENNTMIYDELFRMALIANDLKFKCLIAGYSRPWHFDNDDQFRNMRIK